MFRDHSSMASTGKKWIELVGGAGDWDFRIGSRILEIRENPRWKVYFMRKKRIPDQISEIPQNPRWKVQSENRKLGATKSPEFALSLCCVSTHL